MLPLIAIVDAQYYRFGGSPLYIVLVTQYDTAAIHKYPCFVALTFSVLLRTLATLLTEFIIFKIDRFSRIQHRHVEASIVVSQKVVSPDKAGACDEVFHH